MNEEIPFESLATEKTSDTEREINRDIKRLNRDLEEALVGILLGEKASCAIVNRESGEIIVKAGQKITKSAVHKIALANKCLEIETSLMRMNIMGLVNDYEEKIRELGV